MAEHNKLNQEFYAYAANLLESKPETVKKYWQACVETIVHMLHFDGRCQMPGVGTFELKEVPSWTGMAKDDNGDLVERTIPAWFKITYKSNDDFINNVNGRGVTKKYRKRVRERKLTPNDLKLITQAEDGIRDFASSRGLGDVYKRQIGNYILPEVIARYRRDFPTLPLEMSVGNSQDAVSYTHLTLPTKANV